MNGDNLSSADRRALEIDAARKPSRRRAGPLLTAALAVLIGLGAPSIWVATIFSGIINGSGALAIALLAAIPSTLLVGLLAAASQRPTVLAFAACIGQAVASFLFGYYVGMGLDGHSQAAAHFSIAPLFAPVVAYALAALVGAVLVNARKGKI